MIRLDHYDDKKEKPQSHVVKLTDEQLEAIRYELYAKGLYTSDFPYIIGYGKNKEEALENFKKDFNTYCEFILDLKKRMDEGISLEDLN